MRERLTNLSGKIVESAGDIPQVQPHPDFLRDDMKKPLFIVIFGVIGILLLAGAGFWAYAQNQFLRNALKTTGSVTRLERRESHSKGRTSYSYFPEIQFKTATGEPGLFVSQLGSSTAKYREGDTVEVIYDPRNPEHAEINSFGSTWGGPLICLVLGMAGVVVSISVGTRLLSPRSVRLTQDKSLP